jgi:hypothetical protein
MIGVRFRPAAGSGDSVLDCEDMSITSDVTADLASLQFLELEMLGANHTKTLSISRPEDL